MREVKPTQKPVPSSDIKDLFFNSGLLDIWATSLERKYIDRFGNCHLTAAGMEWIFNELVEKFKVDMNTAIVAAGYITVDSFQQGADLPNNELTQRNHILRDETTGEYYRWDGDLPKQVPAGSTPQSTGGIGKGAWVSVGDASLRSDIKNGDGSLIGAYPSKTLDEKLQEIKNVADSGVLLDGTPQSDEIQEYIDNNANIIIPDGKKLTIDKDIKIRTHNIKIYGEIDILNNARVLAIDNPLVKGRIYINGTVGKDIVTTTDPSLIDIGNFIFLSNGKENIVDKARSSPVDSINVFEYIKNDDVETERKGWYQVVGISGNKIALDRTLLFSVNGDFDVTDKLYTLDINVKIRSEQSAFEKQSLIVSNSFASKIELRDSVINSLHLSYYCAKSHIYGSNINLSGGVRLHHHCDSNYIYNNTIHHSGEGDGALLVYDNGCRNIIYSNVINGDMSGSRENFSLALHTNSDENIVISNVLTGNKGVSDYMFNKNNKFTSNIIRANEMLASAYCLNTTFTGNTFINVGTITSTGSKIINYFNNSFINQYKVNSQLINTYDSGNKPFGIVGFVSNIVDEVVIDSNIFKVENKSYVNFREFVNYSNSSNNFLDYDSDFKRKQVCVGSIISSFKKVLATNNTFNGYNCVYMLINGSSGVPSILESNSNKFNNCDVGLVARISNINSLSKSRTHKLDSDVFNGDIYIMAANYPIQCSSPTMNCNSGIYYCGDKSSIYASLISTSRKSSDNCKIYDFSGNEDYYSTGLIPDGRHANAKFMDIGFEYRINGYVTYINTLKWDGSGKTVKIEPPYKEF